MVMATVAPVLLPLPEDTAELEPPVLEPLLMPGLAGPMVMSEVVEGSVVVVRRAPPEESVGEDVGLVVAGQACVLHATWTDNAAFFGHSAPPWALCCRMVRYLTKWPPPQGSEHGQ